MNDLSDSKRAIMREPESRGELAFDNAFVRSLPADPVLANRPRQVQQRLLHARRSDAGRRAAPARLVRRRWAGSSASRAPSAPTDPLVEVLARQSRAARHAALRGALRRPPVRPLGRAARRRPRDHAGRAPRRRRHAPGTAAEGRGPHALLAHRRRPRGAALLAARIPLQRGDALARRADHARAQPRRHRRAGGARHVLRRQSARRSRAPSSAASRPRSCASAISRSSPRRESTTRCGKLADYVLRELLSRNRKASKTHSTRSAAAPRC